MRIRCIVRLRHLPSQMDDSPNTSIEIDPDVSSLLCKFPGLSPNQSLRLILGIDRNPNHEHSPEQFREHVLRELDKAGGSMRVSDLYASIEKTGMLLAGDYRGAEPHWQNRVRYLAESLRKEGILKRDRSRGFWELE